MARNAVGFYWTLPVPWAGFTSLLREIDEAAKSVCDSYFTCSHKLSFRED
jgi:hypothetical protein